MSEDQEGIQERELTLEQKSEFEDAIRSSGADIIQARKYNLSKSYDITKFPDEDRALVEVAISAFTQYVEAPIISDKFKNHEERRNWRASIFKKFEAKDGREAAIRFDEFLKTNKMKRNKISGLIGFADILREDGIIPDELADNLMVACTDILPYVPSKEIDKLMKRLDEEDREYLVESLSRFANPQSGKVDQGVREMDFSPIMMSLPSRRAGRKLRPYKIVDPWEGPTTPEKIEVVERISEAAVDILNFLGK